MTFRVDCASSWDCRARFLRTRSCPTRRSVTPAVGGGSTGTCGSTAGAPGLARANTGVGAREYRVVRGSSIEDVYRSAERVRAAAVGTALNELESQERSGEAPEGSA